MLDLIFQIRLMLLWRYEEEYRKGGFLVLAFLRSKITVTSGGGTVRGKAGFIRREEVGGKFEGSSS